MNTQRSQPAFTDIFIRRPVLALVVSLLILLVGLRALMSLPIRQYPTLESATISVETDYPGASQALMQGFVTTPIAQSIATADGIDYLSSSTTQGKSVIKARLRLNADSNRAMTEIMAKVQEVKYKLPADAYDSIITKLTDAPTAVMYLGFASDTLSIPEITDYIVRVAQPLATTVPGVASADILSGQNLAMRVWLDADRLAAHGLSAGDVSAALKANNVQAAPGQIKGALTLADISANTDLQDARAFGDLVVRAADNGYSLVRLRDVATVEIGGQNYDSSALMNGRRAVYIAVNATPSGNPLEIVQGIDALLPAMERNKPAGLTIADGFDVARFIHASIDEVRTTLAETVVIVVVVIFLFLGSFRAVLIPILTIPLSLIGTAFADAAVRLLAEHPHPAGDGAGDRPGGGRRDRGGREHPPSYRGGRAAGARRADRHARDRDAGDRDDRHPGGGLRADRADGRADRLAVQGVRLHAGGIGVRVGRDRADALADAGLAAAHRAALRRAHRQAHRAGDDAPDRLVPARPARQSRRAAAGAAGGRGGAGRHRAGCSRASSANSRRPRTRARSWPS